MKGVSVPDDPICSYSKICLKIFSCLTWTQPPNFVFKYSTNVDYKIQIFFFWWNQFVNFNTYVVYQIFAVLYSWMHCKLRPTLAVCKKRIKGERSNQVWSATNSSTRNSNPVGSYLNDYIKNRKFCNFITNKIVENTQLLNFVCEFTVINLRVEIKIAIRFKFRVLWFIAD